MTKFFLIHDKLTFIHDKIIFIHDKIISTHDKILFDPWQIIVIHDKLTISSCVSVRMSRYWARGKFGEHERGVRVARGAAECNSSLLLTLLNLCYNVVYEGICFCAISAKLVDSLWLQLQVQVCFQIFITTWNAMVVALLDLVMFNLFIVRYRISTYTSSVFVSVWIFSSWLP